MKTRTLDVWRRLPAAVIGVLAYLLIVWSQVTRHPWTQTWFVVALTVAVAVTFLEPFFARPQDAIASGLGAIFIYSTAHRRPEHGLWAVYLALAILVLVCGVAASTMPERSQPLKSYVNRFSTLFGRAVVVGGVGLLLDAITRTARGETKIGWLIGAEALLIGALAPRWDDVVRRLRTRSPESGIAIAAIGPKLLLSTAGRGTLAIGTPVEVRGGSTVSGVIAARLPHAEGTRYQIALEEDWQELCATFPFDVEIVPTGEQSDVVGSAGEGTTETVLEFEPLRRLEVGQPVILDPDGQNQIYQVARLRLISTSWSGASSLVAHASARQLGRPEGGRIVGAHYLPAPHEPIFAPTDLGDQLPAGYIQIGVIKGTEFPIGIGTSQESRGHIAIYGMSGMGKTAISRRLIEAFGQHEFVLAMDTTGEYSSRFAFPLWQFGADPNWQQGDFDTVGPHVFERPGDAPSYAAKLVKAMMDHARLEYDQGVPSFRTVVFEEAHSFIPEWNFAVGDQDSAVRNTTRFIMQARKYGLRFVIVSQRTAVVSKSAISQCENYVVLRTIDQTSLEYLEAVIGSELRGALPSLNRYEALCVGPAFNADQPVIVTLDPP